MKEKEYVLGKCPACKNDISLNAESCPKCGEHEFIKRTGRVMTDIAPCPVCDGDEEFADECDVCVDGKKTKFEYKDHRTGKISWKDI